MPGRYCAPGGWAVHVIEPGTPDHDEGQWIRVSQYGFWIEGYFRWGFPRPGHQTALAAQVSRWLHLAFT